LFKKDIKKRYLFKLFFFLRGQIKIKGNKEKKVLG